MNQTTAGREVPTACGGGIWHDLTVGVVFLWHCQGMSSRYHVRHIRHESYHDIHWYSMSPMMPDTYLKIQTLWTKWHWIQLVSCIKSLVHWYLHFHWNPLEICWRRSLRNTFRALSAAKLNSDIGMAAIRWTQCYVSFSAVYGGKKDLCDIGYIMIITNPTVYDYYVTEIILYI